MELSLLILGNLISKAIIGGVGFFGIKSKLCDSRAGAFLASFTLYFTGPCALISGFLRPFDASMMQNFGVVLISAFCVYFAFILISRLLAKVFYLGNALEASLIFTNNGSFIISVIASLLGSDYVFYLSAFIIAHQLIFFTYGIKLITGQKKINMKNFLNPNVLAVFIGLILFLLSIGLPEIVQSAIETLGDMHGGLCLIMVGMALAGCNLKEVFSGRKGWLISIGRLVALPMIVALVLAVIAAIPQFTIYKSVFTVVVIAASCPTANNVLQIAMLYTKDGDGGGVKDATTVNVLTTCLCVVTIPVIALMYLAI